MAVDPRRRPLADASARGATRGRPAKGDARVAAGGPRRYDRSAKLGGSTEAGRRTSHCRPYAATRATPKRRGVAVSNGKAPSDPVSASARPEPEPPRSSEPILIPKLRIDFVDFPYLHYSMRLEAAHLGDLLRISVRTGAKTPRGPLPDFHGPRGDHGHRRSERCSSRSRPYLPASGFQGRTTLTEKRELFPDPPAASPGSFRLPGRGTRQRERRNARAARLRAPNTRERFRAGFRNTDRIPFRPTYDRARRPLPCATWFDCLEPRAHSRADHWLYRL